VKEYKKRQIENRLHAFAEHFKAVLITGARQVGKSTLLEHAFPDFKSVTFDPVQDIYNARRDPDLFLDSFPPPLILDEIQFAPELLPALKRRIDTNSAPGQYFLSGSQHLSLLKNVSESLAGRVGILRLGPLKPHEAAGAGDAQPWIERYLDTPGDIDTIIRDGYLPLEPGFTRTIWRGAMPGALPLPDEIIPEFYRSYIETYIERDIRLQAEIRDLMGFGRFMGIAASATAREINISQFGREIGIAPNTARHWLDMLAACNQWKELPAYSGNAVKRVSGKRKGYIPDSGLACFLQRVSTPDALAANPQLGSIFETFTAAFLLSQTEAMPMPPQPWHWRTAAGAEVDIVFERDGKLYPVEIKCKHTLSGHDVRGIRAFAATYPEKAMPGIIVYAGREAYRADKNIIAVPWNTV